MSRYGRLMTRIKSGEQVFIDGATGTEVERRGVPQLDNAWIGGGALSHPEILREVHEDYIRSGADIVISNTFATLKSALRDAGVEQDDDGWLSKLKFWGDDDESAYNQGAYLISLIVEGELTQIIVLDEEGEREVSPTADRILSLLHDQLK